MGFFWDLIVLLLAAAGFAVLNAIAIAGGLFVLHKKMGPAEDSQAFDFTNDDKRRVNVFVAHTLLHGAIPSFAVLLVGYVLHKMSLYFNSSTGGTILFIILLLIQLAGTFLPAKPLQKVEPIRGLILMAFTAVVFCIYFPFSLADLIR